MSEKGLFFEKMLCIKDVAIFLEKGTEEMEDKFFEQFWGIEQKLEGEGYVELKSKIANELKEIKEERMLINMYQRVKLKVNKHEKGIIEAPMLPVVKLVFNPLFSVLVTLLTVALTFFNNLGDIFYNAGMETDENVLTVVEAYGKIMIELYGKSLSWLICFFTVIIGGYVIAYVRDNRKEQRMKKNEIYYEFMLEAIKEEMSNRGDDRWCD